MKKKNCSEWKQHEEKRQEEREQCIEKSNEFFQYQEELVNNEFEKNKK